MSKKNKISPEQAKLANDALQKYFTGQLHKEEEEKPQKFGKKSELDKKIISLLRIHNKPADLESDDAYKLRMFLSGYDQYKPDWLTIVDKETKKKVEVEKKKKKSSREKKIENEPSILMTEYEKLENDFQDRIDELWGWMEEQGYDEDKIYKELGDDARLEVLYKKMKLNLDKQNEHGILEDYFYERQRDDWPFVEEIDSYLKEQYPNLYKPKKQSNLMPPQMQQQPQPPQNNMAQNVPVPGKNQGMV
tara:strand:- start:5696 stop:6439 length:744 start_codon:yes stop_codon:yes gene_type:complete